MTLNTVADKNIFQPNTFNQLQAGWLSKLKPSHKHWTFLVKTFNFVMRIDMFFCDRSSLVVSDGMFNLLINNYLPKARVAKKLWALPARKVYHRWGQWGRFSGQLMVANTKKVKQINHGWIRQLRLTSCGGTIVI